MITSSFVMSSKALVRRCRIKYICIYTVHVPVDSRAELREADRLLLETETDLAEAQREARTTIQQYDQAKQGLQVRDVM